MNPLKLLALFSLLLGPLNAADGLMDNGTRNIAEKLNDRDKLLSDFSRETRELDALEKEYQETLSQEAFITQLSDTLEKLSPDSPMYDSEKERLKNDISDRQNAIGTRTSKFLTGEIATKKQSVQEMGNKLKSGANSILGESVEQEFRISVSYVFAGLICLVIVGFFSIAFRDGKVRLQVFTGDNGIQFVTLFSLVIAIILFGIMKVLEGKELSALLGGLSGYILGRARTNQGQPGSQADPATPQAHPAAGQPDLP